MDKQTKRTYQFAGLIFLITPLLIQIPYTLLIMNFQYPEILREPTETIFIEFQKGGSSLIWTWLFFGFAGLPLVYSYLALYQLTKEKSQIAALAAVIFGISALFFQLIGLLRWVFVVPILTNLYTDINATVGTKEAVIVSFQTIHHLFGVLIGEHLGQLFTILWMAINSVLILKEKKFPKWLESFGLFSSIIYILAQTELLSLVIPEISEIPFAGLIGSLCWLLWMVILGYYMFKKEETNAVL